MVGSASNVEPHNSPTFDKLRVDFHFSIVSGDISEKCHEDVT